jgi:DNA-binding CsgD family transcriptional regulator
VGNWEKMGYFRYMPWLLEGKLKDNPPWNIPVAETGFSIGRNSSCQLILNAASVSRRHGTIFFHHQEPYLADLGSRNGTFVNGCRISGKTRLKEGDIISFGAVDFLLRYSDDADEGAEKTIIDDGTDRKRQFSEFFNLSEREEEVLFLLVKGLSIKDIAEKLFISPGTVKNHVLKIYAKTGAHSRIELANLYQEYSG